MHTDDLPQLTRTACQRLVNYFPKTYISECLRLVGWEHDLDLDLPRGADHRECRQAVAALYQTLDSFTASRSISEIIYHYFTAADFKRYYNKTAPDQRTPRTKGKIATALWELAAADDAAPTKGPQNRRANRPHTPNFTPLRPPGTAFEQVQDMVGLAAVKEAFFNIRAVAWHTRIRRDHGLIAPLLSHHAVFVGNPGTGKTTVARRYAELLHDLELLPTPKCVEVDRTKLVAGYIGQSEEKTASVIAKQNLSPHDNRIDRRARLIANHPSRYPGRSCRCSAVI